MGWISANVSSETANSSSNSNQYGTHTPLLSQNWADAFKEYGGNIDATGANETQRAAIDAIKANATNNAAAPALLGLNNDLTGTSTQLTQLNGALRPMTTADPRQLLGSSPTVAAQNGANFMSAYKNPYDNDVVNTTLSSFDRNTDRTLNAMRAARDAGSAFGDRSAIGDAVYLGDASLNRASTEAGIRNLGFTTAANLGQQDANRVLAADTANAQMQDSRDKFNVTAGYQGDQQKLQAAQAMASTLAAQAGITQSQAANIVSANGINVEAAQNLLAAGAITQSQLQDVLNAAGAANGYQYTQNTSTTGSSNSDKYTVGAG